MKWSRLKNNKCPQCNKDLALAGRVETYLGIGLFCPCGFTISDKKFNEIVSDKIKGEIAQDMSVSREDFI